MRIKLSALLLIALFAALTALGAFLRVPLPYGSITMQLPVAAMAGLLLGAKKGAASQLIYVLLGIAGLPIFADGGGLMYLVRPTFGMVLGLIPTAYIIGRIANGTEKLSRLLAAEAVGLGMLYAIGLPYMYLTLGGTLSPLQTLFSGCLLYLPFDLLKLICAALLARRLLPILKRT